MLEFLNIQVIDEFKQEGELIAQCKIKLSIDDTERRKFGMNIDKDDYNDKAWLVMSNFDVINKKFNNLELFYLSTEGLVVANKQLDVDEESLIKDSLIKNDEFIRNVNAFNL